MKFPQDNWCELPTKEGNFRMYDAGDELVRVVSRGPLEDLGPSPLVRLHSSCLASEVFGAVDCDCADQLRESMKLMATEGQGLIIHLHQEGRGQGLAKKIKAVRLMQRDGLDTVEAFEALNLEQDIRRYDLAVELLQRLGIKEVRLISNNPRKRAFLEAHGLVVQSVRTSPCVRPENAEYLQSKNAKLGHKLPLELDAAQGDGPIHFYHSDQPWGELSNFSRHAVYLRGRVWATVEHFYQAQKFEREDLAERVRQCQSPMLAKLVADELSPRHRRAGWPDMKEEAMLEGLRAKFRQHPDLAARLVESSPRHLAEHTAKDDYWGDGGDGSGLNRLGELLMQVRDELRSDDGLSGHGS